MVSSKVFKGILCGIGAAIIVLVIFQAGMFVGFRKASFSYGWGDNFYRTFGGHPRNSMMGLPRGGYANPHGANGKIVKIELPTFVVEEPDQVEKVIVLTNDTEIRRFRDDIQAADLKVNDFVVVIGEPNAQSQVEARLIRVLPEPPQFNSDR